MLALKSCHRDVEWPYSSKINCDPKRSQLLPKSRLDIYFAHENPFLRAILYALEATFGYPYCLARLYAAKTPFGLILQEVRPLLREAFTIGNFRDLGMRNAFEPHFSMSNCLSAPLCGICFFQPLLGLVG